MSKALARSSSVKAVAIPEPDNPVDIAHKQLETLMRVLEPLKAWSVERPGKMALDKRPEAEKALIAVRELKDTAEKGRTQLTKPLVAQKKEIDDLYKLFKEAATVIDGHLWSLIQGAREQETAIAMKAAEKVAKAAEKNGAVQFAADVRERATEAPALRGLSEQVVVSAEVVDLAALVKAVAAGTVPLGALEPVQSVLTNLIKGGMTIPGVKRNETSVARRTR